MSLDESSSASDAILLFEEEDLGVFRREAQEGSLLFQLEGGGAESDDAEVVSSRSGFWRAKSWKQSAIH